MRKLILGFALLFVTTFCKSQKIVARFDYTDFSEFFTQKNYLSGLNYLYSVGKDDSTIMAYSLNFLTNKKDSSIITIADSLRFTKLNFFTDSFYVEVLESKLHKKNSYMLVHNFITQKTSLELANKREKEKDYFIKSARDGNKMYKLYSNKKSAKLDFAVVENANTSNTIFNTKEVSDNFKISENKLLNFIEGAELNMYNDVAFFVDTKDKKCYEVACFNLKTKEVNYNKIKRSQDLCTKDPNGIFYSDATFFNGNIYATVCCRHNANLFIYKANSGEELKHFALNAAKDTSLRQSHLYLEHYNTNVLENIENKDKFYSNLDMHPILIDVNSLDEQNTIVDFGTIQKEKVLVIDPLSVMIAMMPFSDYIFFTRHIVNLLSTKPLLNYYSFYPKFYNYHQDITTAKYFSIVLDNKTLNPNLSKTTEYHQFKQNNRPFSDKKNDIIKFKIKGIDYSIKSEDSDRIITVLQN